MGKAYKFNPGFQTDEEAVSNFIVRQGELAAIIDTLRDEEQASRLSVVAPRGAGKTTLCRRVVAEVRTDALLSTTWQPIFLGEESYIVTTPGEFFLECLFHLAEDLGDADLKGLHAKALMIADDQELLDQCLTILRDFSEAAERRLLVIVENFHILLNDQIGRDRTTLLDTLADESLFGILATSVAQCADEDGEMQHVFSGYRMIALKPLTLEECRDLWSALTRQEVHLARIRPLQILTGGSPRLVQILSEFMTTPSLAGLMGNLNQLIDQNTEYFKSQLDTLPAVERKVFAALLDAWDPSTAKQVAEAARVNVNTASAMLGRLSDRGAVIKEPGGGRTVYYYAAERLFNIYYLMRRRSHPSNRVRALVAFMTEYYDRDELVATTAKLVDEACQIDPAQRGDYHWAFDAILTNQPEIVRDRILAQTPPDFLQSLHQDIALDKSAAIAGVRSPGKQEENVLERVIKLSRDALTEEGAEQAMALLRPALAEYPRSPLLHFQVATIHLHENDMDAAVEATRKGVALSEDNAGSHSLLGVILSMADRAEEAELAFERALSIDPKFSLAIGHLAELREDNEDEAGAIELYRAQKALGELSDEAAARFARLLFAAGKDDEGEQVLRDVLQNSEERLESRQVLASWLLESERTSEAAALLRDFAEHSDDWRAWADLGAFHYGEHQYPESIEAFGAAIAEGAESPAVYHIMVNAMRGAGIAEDSIMTVADELLERHREEPWALIVAGDILAEYRVNERAEALYRQAAAQEFGDQAWVRLAVLLARNAESPDADAALERAIATAREHENCNMLRDVAEVLVHKGEDEQADALLAEALVINENCFCCRILQGGIATRRCDLTAARAHFQSALDLNENAVPALLGLASVSNKKAAAELVERATEVEPENPRCLLARAQLGDHDVRARLADGTEALKRDPDLTEARLFLAPLEARRGDQAAALEHLAAALRELETRRELIPSFVDTSLDLVRDGLGAEVSKLLQSDAGRAVEPLAVALQLARGENPAVAKEVLEVAHDILAELKDNIRNP